MRIILIASCWFWLSSGALADCESDVRAAFARISNSGPYHFDKLRLGSRKTDHLIGKVIPGYRIYYRFEGEEHEEFFERTPPNNFSAVNLEKDAFGWKGPFNTGWNNDDEDPDRFFEILEVRCLNSISENEKTLLVFQRTSRRYRTYEEEYTLFVDSASGLPVRRELRNRNSSHPHTVTTYAFDPAITIDPPRINLKARWDASIKAYAGSVQASEPSCREEVLDVLDRGSATLPFEYDVAHRPLSSVSRLSGIFVPPYSLYQKLEGWHGQNEIISIVDKVWVKSMTTQGFWREAKAFFGGGRTSREWQAPIYPYFDPFMVQKATPTDSIGYANCSSAIIRDGRTYLAYRYDVFRDTRRERKLLAHRVMFVDPEVRLPLKFASRWGKGPFIDRETRRYDASLKVEAPKPGE